MAFGSIKCDMGSRAEDEDGHSTKLTTYPKQWTLRAYVHLNVTPQTFICQNIIMWVYLREIVLLGSALKCLIISMNFSRFA
jgi:hypothetical protein